MTAIHYALIIGSILGGLIGLFIATILHLYISGIKPEISSGTCTIFGVEHKRIREAVVFFEPSATLRERMLPAKQNYLSFDGILLRKLYVLSCLRALTPAERHEVLNSIGR